jgi:hypothetical protein
MPTAFPVLLQVGHYAMGGEPVTRIEQHPQLIPKRDTPDGCEDLDDLCYEWSQVRCVRLGGGGVTLSMRSHTLRCICLHHTLVLTASCTSAPGAGMLHPGVACISGETISSHCCISSTPSTSTPLDLSSVSTRKQCLSVLSHLSGGRV